LRPFTKIPAIYSIYKSNLLKTSSLGDTMTFNSTKWYYNYFKR
jgi:hypothetical protein